MAIMNPVFYTQLAQFVFLSLGCWCIFYDESYDQFKNHFGTRGHIERCAYSFFIGNTIILLTLSNLLCFK